MPSTDKPPQRLARALRIANCPTVQTSVLWPYPVDLRLSDLVDLAIRQLGGEISRSDLVAALVAAASTDPEALATVVMRYRAATVAQVSLRKGPVVVQNRRPGRRPRG